MTVNVLLCVKDNEWGNIAAMLAGALLGDVQIDSDPKRGSLILPNNPDCILISFLYRKVFPQSYLDKFSLAINFHPGSIDYPGIGCYNFAIYHKVKYYGVTCHHMVAGVDMGPIISQVTFPMFQDETVGRLQLRSMITLLELFHEIIALVALGKPLPTSPLKWTRKAYTFEDLDTLKQIIPGEDDEEIKHRVQACAHPDWKGAYIELGGVKFYA